MTKAVNFSELQAFPEGNINATKKSSFFGGERVENIVGKRNTASYKHFFPFPYCFKIFSLSEWLKVGIVS